MSVRVLPDDGTPYLFLGAEGNSTQLRRHSQQGDPSLAKLMIFIPVFKAELKAAQLPNPVNRENRHSTGIG